MANEPLAPRVRRKFAAEWASLNTTLLRGEIAVEIDTHLMKVGDGETEWSLLPYVGVPDLDGVLETSDVAEVPDLRYVTDADLVNLSNLSGVNTGDQTNITGNAGTATALQTPRNINGVSFDGTADITVPAAAGTLTGATLAANVLNSSLTSVGTLTDLTVTNPISGSVTGSSASTSGNAATATALQTSRNINGVAFNGTADITVPAAAGTLTGATLAANVLNSSLTSVGTLGNLTVTNPISGSVTGNAGTATTLQTARTIDGTSFNGSANITVVAPAISAAPSKATPVDADEFGIADSAAAFVLKSVSLADLKSTLTAYFNTQFFTSANQVITSGGLLTIAHGLGVTPAKIEFALVNNTAELNYSIGDVVPLQGFASGNNQGCSATATSTNLLVRYGSAASVFNVPNKNTGAHANITNANWRLRVYAKVGI